MEVTGRDPAVATVVAATGEDDDLTFRRCRADLGGDSAACCTHHTGEIGAPRNRRVLNGSCLLGGECANHHGSFGQNPKASAT
jgi:hypothetical protein